MDRVPDALCDASVVDDARVVLRFGDLYAERAAVIGFLRHFG